MKQQQKGFVQYVGIAADEPKRLAKLKNGKTSLLAKYGYTEAMAADLCREYGLLSPIYEFANRGGGVGSARIDETKRSGTFVSTTLTCGLSY